MSSGGRGKSFKEDMGTFSPLTVCVHCLSGLLKRQWDTVSGAGTNCAFVIYSLISRAPLSKWCSTTQCRAWINPSNAFVSQRSHLS